MAFAFGGTFALAGWAVPAAAQGQQTPPDLNVCDGVTCDTLPTSICDPGGFSVTLDNFTPANDQNSGEATYTYKICSPAAGICNGTVRPGQSCLDNNFCKKQGPNEDPTATCSRQCAVDEFHGLSHFDVVFPELGPDSCLPLDTDVSGTCSNGNFVLGDGSCFDGSTSQSFVAKCDNTTLVAGQCLTMTVSIPGEENKPGLGTAVLVSKESTECNASCLAGPSCQPCDDGNGEDECLTRTRGFWGTHPHIIKGDDERSLNLLPILVCGKEQTVTDAGSCGTSEALCTNAQDRRGNEPSLTLVAQLTAAKLNLEATALVSDGACSDWEFNGQGIQAWIDECEAAFCAEQKQAISESGCIEALDAFNNSEDTGFDQTPEPFNRPGPALVQECQEARGNRISNYTCSPL
jgi:hypothetical protein